MYDLWIDWLIYSAKQSDDAVGINLASHRKTSLPKMLNQSNYHLILCSFYPHIEQVLSYSFPNHSASTFQRNHQNLVDR